LFVFVFFGLVATVGSAYVQTAHLHGLEFVAAVPVGLLAVALLVVNNLRDIPGDTVAAKRTLAVRLGDARTRAFYVGCIGIAFVGVAAVGADRTGGLLALLALPLAARPARRVLGGASGSALIPVLGDTARLQLVAGLLLTVGVLLGHR
jgi:1,4-dihydroxy-2-naphthoate octaprenyltransferase